MAIEDSDVKVNKKYPGDSLLKACAIAKQRPIAVISQGTIISLYSVEHTLDECSSGMSSTWFCQIIDVDVLRNLLQRDNLQTPLIVLSCHSNHYNATESTDIPPR